MLNQVNVLGTLPPKGFPQIEDPLGCLKRSKIAVFIDRSNGVRPAKMLEETFSKGFNKMTASDRRLWLADIASGAFKILPDPGLEEGDDEDLDGAPITREGGQRMQRDSEGEWEEAA